MPPYGMVFEGIVWHVVYWILFNLQCKALCWKKKMFCQKQDHKWLISHIGSDNHLIFMLSQQQNWQFVSVHYGCVIVSSF